MKKVTILFLLIFSNYGFSQEEELGLNIKDENGLKQGAWVVYTPKGNALSLTTFKDDSYHGIRIKFYSDRNMMRLQEHYKMGIQSGDQFYYDTGGR
jgi:antitoxin component YwqK of YwqJK toxin-antitoxin module